MWTVDITNDPTRDFKLYMELLEDDKFRGRVELDDSGHPVLVVYPGSEPVRIPGDWLAELLQQAKAELTEHAEQ